MKLRHLSISNLRSIPKLEWNCSNSNLAGWHVILGDNGAGKSSILRALALALVGPKEALAARQEWQDWIGSGANTASIIIEVVRDASFDSFSGAGRTGAAISQWAGIRLIKAEGVGAVRKIKFTNTLSSDRHIWGSGAGWFSAAYGPFRRFSGGDKDAERIFLTNPKLGAHISVFSESIALTESLLWLRELHYKRLENSSDGALIFRMKVFLNQQGFLPHGITFKEVSSRGVEFETQTGKSIFVEELSDGYRSVLSMTFELIRQLCRFYPENRVFSSNNESIVAPGVVLIDEVDAHLHPTWQKRIGFWLTAHFPNIQFIVTTHSPLVCQAAISGSVFHLSAPGSNQPSEMISGRDLDRLLYGDVLEAYSTEAFGTTETRSNQGTAKRERLAALNAKELFGSLSGAERSEQQKLHSIFASSPDQVESGLIS